MVQPKVEVGDEVVDAAKRRHAAGAEGDGAEKVEEAVKNGEEANENGHAERSPGKLSYAAVAAAPPSSTASL